MSEGWIKLHRQLQNCFLWNDKPYAMGQAWVDLLLLANHDNVKKPYKGEIITCERGTVNRSITELAERWGWDRKKVRRFLSLLESDKMVSVYATTHRTIITLVNYENFQVGSPTNVQQMTNHSPTNDQPFPTNKNDKNVKNEKNIYKDSYFDDENLNNAFKDFILFRKSINKPLKTEKAITLNINKLNELSKGDSKLAIAIINQSIMKGWQTFYELKNDFSNNKTQPKYKEFMHREEESDLEKELLAN